jgi:hypothetical protein
VAAIKRELMVKGRCNVFFEVDLTDSSGLPVTASTRLNIAGGVDRPLTSWTLALKLHNVRIDGIDHEFRFNALGGDVGHGWHRHQWDQSEETADHDKVPITDLDDIASGEEFLLRGLSVLKISANPVDYEPLLWD